MAKILSGAGLRGQSAQEKPALCNRGKAAAVNYRGSIVDVLADKAALKKWVSLLYGTLPNRTQLHDYETQST